MLDFFRDPAWQFVGVVLALLSLGGASDLLAAASGEGTSIRLIRRIACSSRGRSVFTVTVQLDGKPIKNLHLLVLRAQELWASRDIRRRFRTAANYPLLRRICVVPGTCLSVPKNLGATLEGSDRSVRLEPLLLNSGDHLLIQVLLSAPVPIHASVDARIVDVVSLVAINSSPLLPPFFRSGMPLLIAISVGLSLISFFASQDRASAMPC